MSLSLGPLLVFAPPHPPPILPSLPPGLARLFFRCCCCRLTPGRDASVSSPPPTISPVAAVAVSPLHSADDDFPVPESGQVRLHHTLICSLCSSAEGTAVGMMVGIWSDQKVICLRKGFVFAELDVVLAFGL